MIKSTYAVVAELVDAQVSKTCEPLKLVSVRLRPTALKQLTPPPRGRSSNYFGFKFPHQEKNYSFPLLASTP